MADQATASPAINVARVVWAVPVGFALLFLTEFALALVGSPVALHFPSFGVQAALVAVLLVTGAIVTRARWARALCLALLLVHAAVALIAVERTTAGAAMNPGLICDVVEEHMKPATRPSSNGMAPDLGATGWVGVRVEVSWYGDLTCTWEPQDNGFLGQTETVTLWPYLSQLVVAAS